MAAFLYFLVLLVKLTFIPIRPQHEPFCPWRGPAHLITDGVYTDVFLTFDDQFIMDVAHNGTAPEGLHGIAEDVPGRSLNDVFHELWSVAFQPLPFF